jgi:hypothetical protein
MSEALRLATELENQKHQGTRSGSKEEAATELRRLAGVEAELQQARELCERLKSEAKMHAHEARAANETLFEIYQAVSGGTGEPGNWHGSKPVVDALQQAREERTAWRITAENAEAAVKQARIDALEEAMQAVSAEEILEAEDNADDSYNCGVLDCVRAVEKLKGKTP